MFSQYNVGCVALCSSVVLFFVPFSCKRCFELYKMEFLIFPFCVISGDLCVSFCVISGDLCAKCVFSSHEYSFRCKTGTGLMSRVCHHR